MPPLKLMGQTTVHSILEGMERRGEIGHDWRTTWPYQKQVAVAHSLHGGQLEEYERQMGRAQEWPLLGEEYGGPLRGGAGAWYTPEPGHAPYPTSVFGTVPGWEPTEAGIVGPGKLGAAKLPKRFRLSTQEYGLPVDRPAVSSWIEPAGGGEPTRGAVVQTAFMHGLPPGAGAVSPAFPEVAFPFTKQVPITPGAQITAVARPGAVAQRGGALELLRTTQGKFEIPTKDWEYQRLVGQPKIVPYSMAGRPEVTQAYQFEIERVAQAQQGMVSQKSGMVKAFMGTGYDPQAMFGPDVEQILPWPKEPSAFMAQALGTPYGRGWYEQWAAGAGEQALPPGTQWQGTAAEQLTRAGEAFIQEHTAIRQYPMVVSEELLGTRRGGEWAEKTGKYWDFMPTRATPSKGGYEFQKSQPEPMGTGRWRIQQRRPVLEIPWLTQMRREYTGRPFVGHEELAQLSLSRPGLEQRLWQEGAEARRPYQEMIKSVALSRQGQAMGTPITEQPWEQIRGRARTMMEEELGWTPEGQRIPGQYLARAGAEVAPGPMTAQFGGKTLQLPGFETMARLGVPGPLGEEVSPMMTSWHRLVAQAAMVGMPGGMEAPGAKTEMRSALRQFWLGRGELQKTAEGGYRVERGMGLKTFTGMPSVQREVLGTRPTSAWEGPAQAHTGLRPGEKIYGETTLREMSGARSDEEFALFKQRLKESKGQLAGLSWRRPVSDPFGQIGGQSTRVYSEEMARERGMDVVGLGRGVMFSPFALFEQRGDVDADRLIEILEEKVKWIGGEPVMQALKPGIERGIGTVRRIAGALRLHAPGQTPPGSAMQQIFGSEAKFNEARSWMQEIQKMGRMQQVTEFFGGTREAGAVSWEDIAQSTQLGLASKEAMGRTYQRFIREMRPEMTQTPTGRRAFRGVAAGPYQSAIDVTQLSEGARTYLAMHETLGTIPKEEGYGFGEVFSPYERTEEGGLKPRLSKLRGYGAIAGKAIGSIMGMEEVPMTARAYLIGGEEHHRAVQRMMLEKKQPAEVMAYLQTELNVPEYELLAAKGAGPGLTSLARKLYSKTPEGEQTYTKYTGEERTVQMGKWAEAPPLAQEIREAGQRMGVTMAVHTRGRGLPVKQFEQALAGGMELTPEQEFVMQRAAGELGIGGVGAPPPPEPPTAVAAPADPYGPQPVPPRRGRMGPVSDAGLREAISQAAAPGAGRGPLWGGAPQPTLGGGGGPAQPPSGYGAMPGVRWHETRVWGGGGETTQRWMEETQMRGVHVQGLGTALEGMARNAPAMEKAFKDLTEASENLNKTFEEGGKLRKEEVQTLKERQVVAKDAVRLAKQYQSLIKPTMGMGGTEEAKAMRGEALGQVGPLMAQAQLAQTQVAEAGLRLPGVMPGGDGGGGLLAGAGRQITRIGKGALSGWGMMKARRMWSMFGAPVQQAMEQYAGGQLQMQQAMYMGGLPTGMGGAPIDILQRRAGAAQFREGIGEAGWQAWGGIASPFQGEPGPLGPLAAIGGPAIGLGAGAAMLGATAPLAVGLGLGAAAVGAAGYAVGAGRDQESIALAAAQAQQEEEGGLKGFGKWAWQNFRGLTGVVSRGWQETGGNLPGFLGGLVTGQVGFQQEDVAYGQQIMGGNLAELRDPEGRLAAMKYFTEKRLGPRLPGVAPEQLRGLVGGYLGMTGETDLGKANLQLLQQAGERQGMLGQPFGAAFQPFQEIAGAMGLTGTGMAEQLANQAPWGEEQQVQQYLRNWGNVAPMMRQAGAMFGPQAQTTLGMWQGTAGGGLQQQRMMQQVLSGNRYRWSDIGRAQQRPELVTMEESGLPIYTQELRGMEDEMREQQRGYRSWRSTQQYDQMQENQQYIRAGWTIQDQQRQLRSAQTDWQYGYSQRAFALGGQQWMENYTVQGRQQQEAMALGRQMFETRVGFQQQDIQRQQGRQQQQFQWRMEDWTYQESRAQLSYGWQMEDLSEAVRYSSGRQRRQLMKQQERGTISESMRRAQSEEQRERMEEQQQWSEEDFERQRERNEELVRLQREQWEMRRRHLEEDREMSLRHHEEDREMQEERLSVNRDFYLQGKELDDDRIQLQREHAEQQFEWQIEAWEKQKEFNEEMDKMQDAYRDLQRDQQDIIANFQRMLTYTEEMADAFLEFMGEAKASVPQPTERQQVMGMQSGGFVRRTERAMLHEGEHVVPAEGQLIIRGDNPESIAKWEEMIRLLGLIAGATEAGKSNVVVVETNNAQRAADHALSLADEGWGIMPGA